LNPLKFFTTSDQMNNSKSGLKLVFAGTPEFAASHLASLLRNKEHQVIAAYTQPDRPAGRGRKLKPGPVKTLALEHGIPVYQPASLRDPEAQAELAALGADLMVVVAYGLILPAAVLQTPRLGCINVHASLLPRWRGAAPIQRAIEAGDGITGITIMQMDEGLDTGDMLLRVECPIDATDTATSLHDKLASIGAQALHSAIAQLASGSATPEKQDDSLSNYADKITKEEAAIDWALPANQIERKIRAFNAFPVTWAKLGKERIKIWLADVGPDHNAAPGTIVDTGKQGIVVACGEGSLCLKEIQLAGGKPIPATAALNARAVLFAPGSVLGPA
jgi:methionyl-tRNA formyltransferase